MNGHGCPVPSFVEQIPEWTAQHEKSYNSRVNQ